MRFILIAIISAYGWPAMNNSSLERKLDNTLKMHGGPSPQDLAYWIPKFKYEGPYFQSILYLMGLDMNYPLGAYLRREPPQFKFDFDGGTVRQALDKFIELYPEFEWSYKNQVVYVGQKPDGSPDPLEIIVPRFKSERFDLSGTVRNLAIAANKLGEDAFVVRASSIANRFFFLFGREDSLIDIETTRPMTVRNILNEIVLKDPPGYWWAQMHDGKVSLYGVTKHQHQGKELMLFERQRQDAKRKETENQLTPAPAVAAPVRNLIAPAAER